MKPNQVASPEYQAFLESIKERVRIAQVQAVVAVNHELVLLNWEIGRAILARQADLGWGAKVIDQLSRDLRRAFPDMRGFSPRNLKYMRAFAEAWPDAEIVQEALAQITWCQNVALLEKLSAPKERLWYARAAREHGWSRGVLVLQIERKLHLRQGKAVTNFEQALAAPGSDLAQQTLKDPYIFDFLGLADDAKVGNPDQKTIDSNMLDIVEADLKALPKIVEDAKRQLGFEGAKVSLVILKRQLPFKPDVEYRVHISGTRRSGSVSYSAKGKLMKVWK